MLNLFGNILVVAGAGVLSIALIPVHQLIRRLPTGAIRRRWHILLVLIVIFILGYIVYAVDFWGNYAAWHDLVVPVIFFLGAGFVWLTVSLSLQTASALSRVSVLEQENITDPLIGIYNRRYLGCPLDQECARAQQYAAPLSVLLIDIDYFKRINDAYGHQTGDLILRELGKLILQTIRESDIAVRYGGDEILIAAPNTTPSLAGALAERLRQQIEQHEFAPANTAASPSPIRVTISIGVAFLNEETQDSQNLLLNADKALYRAKKEGRNRVAIHGVKAPKTNPELWE